MKVRYFEISYPSKITAHPDGDKKVIIYAVGAHKKQACENALIELEELEGENATLFKLPKVLRELTVEEFEELTEPKPEKEEAAPQVETGFDNNDINLGLTVSNVHSIVAAAVLYDSKGDYSTKEQGEILRFIESPIEHGTLEELQEYTEVLRDLFPLMPQLFNRINEGQLGQIADFMCKHIRRGTYHLDAVLGLLNIWGVEYQQDLPDIKELGEAEPEPELGEAEPEPTTDCKPPLVIDAPLLEFEIPAYKAPCTFNADLAALNARLARLLVGESLILDDISNRLYHATDAYSKSSLDLVLKSPATLQWSKDAPRDDKKEDALIFGTAFHTRVLEPHLFHSMNLPSCQNLNLRTNDGKAEKCRLEAEAKAANKMILSDGDKRHLDLMNGSVFAHPTAKKLLSTGIAERSIFYRYSENLVLRIRPDWINEAQDTPFLIDLKSTPDADKFEKSIDEFNYHTQDAFYSYVYEKATGKKPVFVFVATGKAINCGKYPTRVGRA